MRRLIAVVTLGFCAVLPAWAEAPTASIRPSIRPASPAAGTRAEAAVLASTRLAFANPARPLHRPRLGAPEADLAGQAAALAAPDGSVRRRPEARPAAQPAVAVVAAAASGGTGLRSAPRPEPRPRFAGVATVEKVETVAAVRILPGKAAIFGRKGSVCGDPAIKGETLAPITSRVRGCGIGAPVKVTSVSGVRLTTAATIDCPTAQALNAWVDRSLKPAFGRKDVAALQVAGSYSCRSRNNVRGAPISEHGRGKAIDIAGIVLAGGQTVSVKSDWRRSAGKPMKKAYKAACGVFGTTLSPDADRYHRDHMHFDTARQRGGAYCR